MKKIILAALAILVSASFNTADAAAKKKKDKKAVEEPAKISLITKSDSLSYSAGMVRTDGLVPYLKQGFGVDTAYMADFIKGYEDAVARGIDEKTKAYFAGEQIALMVSQRMLPFLKDEFKGQSDSISEALFNKGFVSALKKDYTLMTDSAAKDYFDKAFKQAVDARNEATRKAGEDFLAANKTKEGVVTLPSGLQYKVLVKGNGENPSVADEVTVKYEGRQKDGSVFDSSYK
ncbi:FKBP-type peptidyl-prolyl cis-trans isomerase N-terminal domain-containing protein, partial [Xylanibacter rarus]|uniref:FKBP-type peptidyl-prolyl cis-trans isomerase N-terminal domain-containing protein n=1 Tax=Xylanibacter rarus TaxID=1676614 RepID=UPI003FD7E0D1